MPLTEENRDEDDLVNLKHPPAIQSHRQVHRLKSGIKGKGLFITNQESQSAARQPVALAAAPQNMRPPAQQQPRPSAVSEQNQRAENQQRMQQTQEQHFAVMLQNQQHLGNSQKGPSEHRPQLRASFTKENGKAEHPLCKSFDGKVKQALQDASNAAFQNQPEQAKKLQISQKPVQKTGQPAPAPKPRRFSPKPSSKGTQLPIQRTAYSRQPQAAASNSYSAPDSAAKRPGSNSQPRSAVSAKRPLTPNYAPELNQAAPQNRQGNAMRYTASGADTSMHLKGNHHENQKNMLYSFRNGPIR